MDTLALRLVNESSDVRRAAWVAGAKGKPIRKGLGCAGSVWYKIASTGPQVLVRVHKDGRVEVENGVQEIGGGVITSIALVVAEELGLSPDRISVKTGDSRYPY